MRKVMGVRPEVGAQLNAARAVTAKVPAVTAWFWLVKLLTTGMGETTSDFMNQWLGPAIAVPIMLVALYVSLRIQLRQREYRAWPYWLVVTMVAVFGTTAADALHVVLGIPYAYSTTFYAVALVVVFAWWYRSEGTLSIHSIVTRRRERFYWATVLVTFALGTAAGDLTAGPMGLSYFPSILLFAGVMLVPAIGFSFLGLAEVAAFWFAYVVTRPLGASIADWIAVTHKRGGLNVGPGTISGILAVAIVAAVGYLAITRRDAQEHVPHDDAETSLALAPVPVD